MPINFKTHIQMQSLKTREGDKSEDRRNMHHSTCDGVRVSDELS